MEDSVIAESEVPHVPATYAKLPDGWSWARLDAICEGVFDCPHSTPKLTEAGPFVVRTQDIITGVFRAEQAGHVSENTYTERTARVVPRHGDVLYSREGTYFGIAAGVPEHVRICLGQRMVLIRPRANLLHFRYLGYWLNSPTMAAYTHGFRDGSVAERLNLPTIRALPVLVPSLPEQRAIAGVLGALRRQDRVEPSNEPNAGTGGAGDLPGVVRGLRAGEGQGRRSAFLPRACPRKPSTPSLPASSSRNWAWCRKDGGCDA